jgi:hypothetical protein
VAAAADDYRVVASLRLRIAPLRLPVLVMSERVREEREA